MLLEYDVVEISEIMSGNFSLGKKEHLGKIDFSKIKAGAKKEYVLNDECLKSVFDMVDKNKDGVLDSAEINSIQGKLMSLEKEDDKKSEEIRKQKAETARQENEYYKKLGVKNFKNKGQKVKAAGWGNKEFEVIGDVDYGRQLVKRNGKLYTRSHDEKILRDDYLQAHKAFVNKPKNQRNNTASGIKGITYVKDNKGKVWYFNEKTGKAIVKGNYSKIVKQESAFVAKQLHTAAKGMGTDEELLEKGIKNIYSRDILNGVNDELKSKNSDYAGDAQTMPVEALILDEMSHSAARPLFRTLINSGNMTTKEKAHTIKREIEHEVHGGLTGYTSTSDLSEIMQLCSDRDTRLEIEAQFKKDHPELAENEGSVVRSYIAGDGWNAQEADQFDANWIKTGAYQEARYIYKTDKNGNILSDKNGKPVIVFDEGDQAHRNGVIGRLVFDYQDKEALNKGLDAVNENPDSFDYQYLDKRAGKEIAKAPQSRYKSRFINQDNIQRYIAGFHSDETGNTDSGNISASNTCLFKGLKPARVQAEESLYKAKNGDYSQVFDTMDSETYAQIAILVANGDVKGGKDMTDLYNKAINGAINPNDKTKIKANAMISGQVNFSDKQIADFCVELMHTIDANKGRGGSTGMSAGYTNDADYQTEQLKAILQNNPQIMDAVKTRVKKENFSYTTTMQSGGSSGQQPIVTTQTTNTKNKYMQLLADTKTIANEEIFFDANGIKITDSKQIEKIKYANMQSLQTMRQYVAELERDFKKGVDAEGTLSDMVNGLSKYSGIGTDRDDVATEYRNAKLMLQQFEAAAQGKLRDSNGNVISAQDLAQQMLDKQNALAESNSDYRQTVAYGKIGIVLAPVIVATIVASGGATAAGWGTIGVAATGGVAAGTTTYGMNALEYNTSYTGDTAEAREQNIKAGLVNGAATAIGIGQMKYIGNIANNMGTVARTGIRLGTTVAADTSAGAAAEYATTGDVTTQGTMINVALSGVGNAIGAKTLGQKQVKFKTGNNEKQEIPSFIKQNQVKIGTGKNVKLLSADVENLLKQSGFNADNNGTFSFEVNSSYEKYLNKYYGYEYGGSVKKIYQRPLGPKDIDNISMMINEASKVIDVSEFDINRVVLLYNSIQKGDTRLFSADNINKMSPAKWALVMNCAKGKQITASQLKAIISYKESSSDINGVLTQLKNKKSVLKSMFAISAKKQIDELSKYIDTQVIEQDITLTRNEGYSKTGVSDNPYGCLGAINYKGKPLQKILDDAVKGGPQKIQDVETELNMMGGALVATNERFTSASVIPGVTGTGIGKVVWNLTLKKGSKGAFLEGNNFIGTSSTECEVLLQRNSKFEITGIQWNDKLKRWVVDADVTN